MKTWLAWLAATTLVGCSSSPIISDPTEKAGSPAQGAVTAMSSLLAGKPKAVVVFVHGVGDHCPGYALDQKTGWLNDAALPVLGLKPKADPAAPIDIYDAQFIPGKTLDQASKVTIITRDFSYGAVDVHAIEITWSQLTQWIKTTQLDYDLTEPVDRPANASPTCPFSKSTDYKKPPSRDLLNASIKEKVIDRSLADAVLYAGDYGVVIQRGVAQALCIALGGSENEGGKLCTWPAPPDESVPNDTVYFFVTHSLGGRILYDTLLGLTGNRVNSLIPVFDSPADNDLTSAKPYVSQLMVNTAAIYMMANQLSLLGLAYDTGGSASDTGEVAYAAPLSPTWVRRLSHSAPTVTGTATGQPNEPTRHAPSGSIVNAFATARMAAAARHPDRTPPRKLQVVAFSDTNDLLSWAIPEWYQRPPDGSIPAVHFTNVYVENSTHWLGVIENPSPAHVDYFVNKSVWQVIHCGAKDGSLMPCE